MLGADAYVKKSVKLGRVMMIKVGTNRHIRTHNREWKTRPISVCV